ncbi:MAG: hypothetical protein WBQ23_12710 [Bacteroidota bacterium]
MLGEPDNVLLPLLRALLAGKIDARSSDALIMATIKRTEQAVYWLSARKNFRFHTLGLTLRDLSYDIAADLLSEDGEYCCAALRNALSSHADAEDVELLSAYDAVLFGNVQRRISHIFAEVSPIQHILMRALRQHVNSSDDIEARDMLDGRWYLLEAVDRADLHKSAAPPDILRQCLSGFNAHNKSDAVEVFRHIVDFLRGQEDYRKAVPEMEVVRITVGYLGRALEASLLHQTPEPSVAYDIAVLSHIVQRSVETVRSSVERLYIERNRLTGWEFELLLYAIKSSFLDLRWGEEQRSGYWFLRNYMPGLTPERYRESYRRKYAYLYDLVLQEAQRLMEAESTFFK